jgi:hypothetical protein
MESDDIARVFGAEIADAVVALSKVKGQSQEEYLDRVVGNPIAHLVKMADALANWEKSAIQGDRRRERKYLDLLTVLKARVNAD